MWGRTYDKVADTVGLVPNVRWKDNLFQGIAVLVMVVIGAGIGFVFSRSMTGALVGVLGGLVAGFLVSGVVLMVIGIVRTANAKK